MALSLAAVLLDVGRQTLAPSVGQILEVGGQRTGEQARPQGEARRTGELKRLGSLQEQHLQAGAGWRRGGRLQATKEDVVHILRICFRTDSVPKIHKQKR